MPIARHLRSNLQAAGIDAQLRFIDVTRLSRQVLLNHDFDIYIGQFPYARPPDPDALYPMFRSTFAAELGWQNPFGFTHLTCDDFLDAQRLSGGEQRQQEVDDLQQLLARTQPFVPLVFPDVQTGVRTDRFTNWNPDGRDPARGGPTQPHNLLQLERVDGEPGALRLAVGNERITSNRNPISAAYQQQASLLDLVYDSITLDTGSEHIPWIARDMTWIDDEGPLQVEIRLRDGLQWHDGEQLSAYDVGFTYEFLRDTSLGNAIRPIPSERFRGRISLVADVTVQNSRELSLTFTDTTQPVAQRALTVPVLPAHIWRDRTTVRRPSNRAGQTTTALTSNNTATIGSGPLQFEEANGDIVEFSRFDPHFLWPSLPAPPTDGGNETRTGNRSNGLNESGFSQNRTEGSTDNSSPTANETAPTVGEPLEPPLEEFSGVPAFETVTVQAVGSDATAVELLTSGDVDATVARLSPEVVTSIEDNQETERIEHRSNAFYHLGFNTRRQPLRNPNVRRLIAQLVDKSWLVETGFGGNGVPAASPLAETEWLADSLQWDAETGVDPEVPYMGTDGELDVEAVRSRFRDIGYQYNNDNELISQIR